MKKVLIALAFAGALLCGASCDRLNTETKEEDEQSLQYKFVNTFLYNSMSTYYLWVDDSSVASRMSEWKLNAEPIETVSYVKHEDDRWTQATDDYDSFISSTSGVSTTYGYDLSLYWGDSSKSYVVAVITLVYPDSPAIEAGLARGDVITQVNGKTMTADDYVSIVNDEMFNSASVVLTRSDGSELTLVSRQMYEDPVICSKILDIGGRKYAYLFYNSFTLKSIPDLVKLSSQYASEGVYGLILDLRYNGGGYVDTEVVLGSLCAPADVVKAETVFHTTKYNNLLADAWGEGAEPFCKEYKSSDGTVYDVLGANMGIKKMYAIVTSSSASASEGLLVGLLPYMDITIVGEQTHGKYCTGIMMSANSWFSETMDADNWSDASKYQSFKESFSEYKKYVDDWGLYVMIGRFADKNGETPCMPAGFTPDVAAADDPVERFEFGSSEESMLAVVTSLIEGDTSTATKSQTTAVLPLTPYQHRPANFGLFVGREGDEQRYIYNR